MGISSAKRLGFTISACCGSPAKEAAPLPGCPPRHASGGQGLRRRMVCDRSEDATVRTVLRCLGGGGGLEKRAGDSRSWGVAPPIPVPTASPPPPLRFRGPVFLPPVPGGQVSGPMAWLTSHKPHAHTTVPRLTVAVLIPPGPHIRRRDRLLGPGDTPVHGINPLGPHLLFFNFDPPPWVLFCFYLVSWFGH